MIHHLSAPTRFFPPLPSEIGPETRKSVRCVSDQLFHSKWMGSSLKKKTGTFRTIASAYLKLSNKVPDWRIWLKWTFRAAGNYLIKKKVIKWSQSKTGNKSWSSTFSPFIAADIFVASSAFDGYRVLLPADNYMQSPRGKLISFHFWLAQEKCYEWCAHPRRWNASIPHQVNQQQQVQHVDHYYVSVCVRRMNFEMFFFCSEFPARFSLV